MRHIFYFFVIISLSFTVNAQLKNKSLEFENEKQTSSAVLLEKESAEIPEEAVALNQKGIYAALKEKDYRKAIDFFRRAAGLSPGCFTCRFNLGKSLIELDRLDEALDILTELVKDKPDYANAYAILGNALFNKNRFEESISAYQKALSIEPNDAFTFCYLGIAQHHAGKYEDALQSFSQAIKTDPKLAEAYSNRGVTLFNLKRLKEALADFHLAEKMRPDTAEIENNIGVTLSQMGKRKEAHKHFEKAVAINPDYGAARYNLALSFLERNDRKQADAQLFLLEKINYAMADQLRKQFWKKYVINTDDLKKALN